VAGGNVDVSAVQLITSAEIGYSFNVEAETLPVDAQVVGGPLTGQPRAINRVILDLHDTLSVSVNGTALVIRQVTNNFSDPRAGCHRQGRVPFAWVQCTIQQLRLHKRHRYLCKLTVL
jgi:hypothetical protein